MESQQLFAIAGVTALLVLGGCLSATSAGQLQSPTPTATPPPAESPASPTPGGHEYAANQPDPDKEIRLENEWNQSVTMRVRVTREATNTTVHDGSYDLAPGSERTVYNTTAADPEGVEAFTVILTARETTERVTIETNKCYGDAYGTVVEDGTVYLYHAIC